MKKFLIGSITFTTGIFFIWTITFGSMTKMNLKGVEGVGDITGWNHMKHSSTNAFKKASNLSTKTCNYCHNGDTGSKTNIKDNFKAPYKGCTTTETCHNVIKL